MEHTVLIVEDERDIAELHRDYLHAAGFNSEWLDRGDLVVDWVKTRWPSLILLDLMLPGKDGIEVCREIRAFSKVPIIIISARRDEIDRLLGLELGADDYICKPFSHREVVVRIKNVLRRVLAEKYRQGPPPLLFDREQAVAQIAGQPLELSAVEFQILQTLFDSPERIFSREELVLRVYGDRQVNLRTIDSHIKKMRRKIGAIAPDMEFIHSVYGAGYQFQGGRDE